MRNFLAVISVSFAIYIMTLGAAVVSVVTVFKSFFFFPSEELIKTCARDFSSHFDISRTDL